MQIAKTASLNLYQKERKERWEELKNYRKALKQKDRLCTTQELSSTQEKDQHLIGWA